MDIFGTQAKLRVAALEVEIDVYRDTNEDLAAQLSTQKELNKALNEENADMVYKHEILVALFKQIHVNVKFPVRKTDK